MAREFARIRIAIADDPDLEDLSADAQWLYFRVLIPEPTLNYAGVADWRPVRLIRKARDMDMARFLRAAVELELGRYALFDLETEEVLVRSFIRGDELLRNPKMAASVIKAYRSVASKTLRAAIVTEIRRDREEHPEYSSWTNKDTAEDLSRLVTRPGLDSVGYTNRITNVDPVPITNPESVPITNRITNRIGDVGTSGDYQSDYQSDSVRIPSNSNIQQSTGNKESGYLGEYVTGADDSEEPSAYCPQHPQGTTERCRDCGHARVARNQWIADRDRAAKVAQSSEAQERAAVRAQAIIECDLCDDDGYAEGRPCHHNPDQAETNARGIELARAALAKGSDDA